MPAWLAKAGLRCELAQTFRDLAGPLSYDFSLPREPDAFMSRWERRMSIYGAAITQPLMTRLSSVV
jgi:hypothetical protein